MSVRLCRNRLVALIATLALITAAGIYSAHGYGDRTHDDAHCDLCVHFSGAAGSPASAKVVGKPILVVWVPTAPVQTTRLPRRKSSSHLPRGPPLLLLA